MKKLLLSLPCSAVLALSFYLTACSGPSPEEQVREPYSLHLERVEAREAHCDADSCSYAIFNLPELRGGDTKVCMAINDDLSAMLREHISARLPDPAFKGSLEEMAEAFVEGYELFTMEFPDMNTQWFFEIRGDNSRLYEEHFLLHVEVSEFMGGAHPNYYAIVENYKLSNGQIISAEEVLNADSLYDRAERAFRQKFGLAAGDDLNAAGFMFPEGRFVVAENIALRTDSITLIYNPYEIAPWSMGSIELSLAVDGLERE